MTEDKTDNRMWAICELFGHRKLAGLLTEQELAGFGFIRLDIYPGDAKEPIASQLYSPKAFFGITPTTEALARAFALRFQPTPVTQWELPQIGDGDGPDDIQESDVHPFEQEY